jgi:hypothetical protein
LAFFPGKYEPFTEEWKYYNKKSGWTLTLKRKKRTILYLAACKGHYIVGLYLAKKLPALSAQDERLHCCHQHKNRYTYPYRALLSKTIDRLLPAF